MGGLSAGLLLAQEDVYQGNRRLGTSEKLLLTIFTSAVLYATVSASFVIEQEGLPHLTREEEVELWNRDTPKRRLDKLLLDTERKQR